MVLIRKTEVFVGTDQLLKWNQMSHELKKCGILSIFKNFKNQISNNCIIEEKKR